VPQSESEGSANPRQPGSSCLPITRALSLGSPFQCSLAAVLRPEANEASGVALSAIAGSGEGHARVASPGALKLSYAHDNRTRRTVVGVAFLLTTLVIVVTPGPGVRLPPPVRPPRSAQRCAPHAGPRLGFHVGDLDSFCRLWRVRGSSPSAPPRSTRDHDLDAAHLRRLLRGAGGAVGCLRAMT
jgi:hypothetical protein